MNIDSIEDRLREFFTDEVAAVEPSSGWWYGATTRATVFAQIMSFWERAARAVPKPVLRAVLPVGAVLIAFGVLWGMGVFPPTEGGQGPASVPGMTTPGPVTAPVTPPRTTTPLATATPPQKSLSVTAVTDKPSYLPGEQVELTFSLTNVTAQPLTLLNFPPYTEIVRAGFLYRAFERGSQEVTLGPGETVTYTRNWDQLDGKGRPVNPAIYDAVAAHVSVAGGAPAITTQEGHRIEAIVNIVFPQGATQKTIEVDQAQTVDGITITLNRVELSASEMKVYVLKTPGYTTQPGLLEPPSRAGAADIRGTYRIDDGASIGTGSFGYRSLQDGVEYVWEALYPAPSDARMLYFTITRISIAGAGDFGPFEFEVPLR